MRIRCVCLSGRTSLAISAQARSYEARCLRRRAKRNRDFSGSRNNPLRYWAPLNYLSRITSISSFGQNPSILEHHQRVVDGSLSSTKYPGDQTSRCELNNIERYIAWSQQPFRPLESQNWPIGCFRLIVLQNSRCVSQSLLLRFLYRS